MKLVEQIALEDISPEYQTFLDKFKPKKTTDDCYTPQNVYDVVLDWVVKEYGIDRDNVVRPFWPGGDYERFDYPDGCTVVDNPPFSILSQICKKYFEYGVKFFLFAPYLTNFNSMRNICHIICEADIMYENGATVATAFVTNLDAVYELRTAPDLNRMIKEVDKLNRSKITKQLPKYDYPDEVLTASMMGYMSKYGVDFRVKPQDCRFVRSLNSQRQMGKTIFGGGYLLSEKAAAEKAAAEKANSLIWTLDEHEWSIIHSLGGIDENHSS